MRRRRFLTAASTAFAAGLAGCGGPGGDAQSSAGLTLAATPFDDGEPIPARYTCDGGDVNPELTISGVPDAAETLALVVDDSEGQSPSGSQATPDDPDAGEEPSVLWLLWNVPADTETIPRSVAKRERPPFAEGARQGENGAGEVGYVGPCPPTSDDEHTYRFRLSAVDTTLDPAAGADRAALSDALSGHVVDSVTLRGHYGRD